MPKRKRKCRTCSNSLWQMHGNAVYCEDCGKKAKLAKSRRWWEKNKYSAVIAEKRKTEADLSLDNGGKTL